MSDERAFKGVWIPKDLWFSQDFSPMEKFFLLEIDSFQDKNGCYASNAHFSKLFGLSKARCTQIIKGLEAKKVLIITLIREGKLIKKRELRVVNILNRGSKYIKQGYLENAQGTIPKEHYKRSSCQRKKFSDDDLILAEFIYKNIQDLNPDQKPPNFETWAATIRLIRERDKKSHKDIQDLFIWANNNPFWQTNILSPAKLRKKWDQLIIKKDQEHAKSQSHGSGSLSSNEKFEQSLRYDQELLTQIEDAESFHQALDATQDPLPTP